MKQDLLIYSLLLIHFTLDPLHSWSILLLIHFTYAPFYCWSILLWNHFTLDPFYSRSTLLLLHVTLDPFYSWSILLLTRHTFDSVYSWSSLGTSCEVGFYIVSICHHFKRNSREDFLSGPRGTYHWGEMEHEPPFAHVFVCAWGIVYLLPSEHGIDGFRRLLENRWGTRIMDAQ